MKKNDPNEESVKGHFFLLPDPDSFEAIFKALGVSNMIDQGQVVKVGIADMNIAKAPNTIRTSGLGSCVGVVLYDERSKIAGLIHVMLPDSKSRKNRKYKYREICGYGYSSYD